MDLRDQELVGRRVDPVRIDLAPTVAWGPDRTVNTPGAVAVPKANPVIARPRTVRSAPAIVRPSGLPEGPASSAISGVPA